MSDLVVSLDDFATYLNDDSINTTQAVRATQILSYAQTLCETVVSPLPTGAEIVVIDVAQRGYANPTSAANNSLALYSQDEGPFNDSVPGVTGGGLWLTASNKTTLRNLAGLSGGAFVIDTCPATAGQNLPPWDLDQYDSGWSF
jgi:hypothetical protein